MENLLGTWSMSAKMELARRLTDAVEASPGKERTLFNKLLEHLRGSLGPVSIEAAQQATGADPGGVYTIANHLRERILNAKITPDPGAYLDKQSYVIRVRNNAPEEWNRVIGPSLGLLLSDAGDVFVGDVIEGITSKIEPAGYSLVVDVSRENPKVEIEKIK